MKRGRAARRDVVHEVRVFVQKLFQGGFAGVDGFRRRRVTSARVDGSRSRVVVLVLAPDHDLPRFGIALDDAAVDTGADGVLVRIEALIV